MSDRPAPLTPAQLRQAERQLLEIDCATSQHEPRHNISRMGDQTATQTCACGVYVYRAEKVR